MKALFLNLFVVLFVLNPFLEIDACTTIIVGKKATEDGKIIIARTSDTIDARRAKNLQFYLGQDLTKHYIGLPYADLENDPQYDMAQVVTNKYGVSLSATQTIQPNSDVLALDTYTNSRQGVSEPNIPALIMPRAKDARQAIDILGSYIQKYGVSGKKGFGVLVADKNEAWYLETLSGHQWVAIKIPDDVYFISANGPGQIQEYLPSKYEYKLSNFQGKNPLDFAVENNIAQIENGVFNFRLTYADVFNNRNNNLNFVRLAYIQHFFNPQDLSFNNESINKTYFSTFLKPKRKISIDDIKKLQASHYEDYPDFDPFIRFNKNESKHTFYYPIANLRTSNAHITEVGDPISNYDFSIANIQYIALGMPTVSFYIPIYYGILTKPREMTNATSAADDISLFWQFRKLQALVFLKDKRKGIPYEFKNRIKYVHDKYALLNEVIKKDQLIMEKTYEKTRDPMLIDEFTKQTINAVSTLNKIMIEHFMDILNINELYDLSSNEIRNQWFTKKVREQDCNYRTNFCKNTFTKENKYLDEPLL